MRYENQSDLIEHLKSGREEAFEFIVDAYSDRLYAYALTLSRNHALAQDITQNVFLKTWERHRKMEIESSLQNYLLKTVRNEFLNLKKKDKRKVLLEQKYSETLEKITANYDDHSLKKAVQKCTDEIQNLPPKCREVFLLSRKEGLTNVEISDYLNVSIKTVEAHISKAFAILRKNLGNQIKTALFILWGQRKANKPD